MKVLVVGVGSIGTRHMQNLVELGHEVYAVDLNSEKLDEIKHISNGIFHSLTEALNAIDPDIAFICTFSNAHIEPAIECAKAGCHLFIEKPLSLNLDGVYDLIRIIEDMNLISMVGCNMRFHPAISYIHNIIETDSAFSKKLWSGLEFGYYLPFAKVDYESNYMAKRSMGGNLIFDVIHELDYAVWFFGDPTNVFCAKGILSNMKIDTEDYADMLIKFKSGTSCNVHLDYLQHGYSRRCKIVCEKGTIVWDFVSGKIGHITEEDKEWVWVDMNLEIYYNQMYMHEIEYFIKCVKDSKETFNSVKDSILTLKLALSANCSADSGMWESI